MEVKEDAFLEAENLPIYDEASSPEDFAAFGNAAVTDKAPPEYLKFDCHLRGFTSAGAGRSA